MPTPRLTIQHAALLVIDVQEKLLPHIHNADALLQQTTRLMQGAAALNIPLLVTEQYPKGLGPTVPQLKTYLDRAVIRHEKLKFSACTVPIREQLVRNKIRQVIVCGVESHVCVLHTCLDLIDNGYLTFLATDASGSRHTPDHTAAVQRMVQAGVVPTTTESALLELVHEAGGVAFKSILPIIK